MKGFILLIFIIVCFVQTYAQSVNPDVIATSGDFYKNSSNSLCWTLGECVTETFTSSGNTLSQGFQQSFCVVTSINELCIEGFSINVYPNPTTDLVNISIHTDIKSQTIFGIEFFDFHGKILYSKDFSQNHIKLDMSSFRAGSYLLKVTNPKSKILQNFKIQKIN